MKSFREHVQPVRHGHLGWRGGDIQHMVGEDTLPHLNILPVIPHENTPDHKFSEMEMHHLKKHQQSLKDADLTHHIVNYKTDSSGLNGSLRHAFHHPEGTMQLNPYRYFHDDVSVSGPYDPEKNHGIIHDRVKSMDHVTSYKTSEPMTLYRGIYRDSGIHRLPHGAHFVDHGYTGTSINKITATDFAEPHNPHYEDGVPYHLEGFHAIARIHAPPGTSGHYIDLTKSYHDDEHEFLLHRGTHFQVTGHSIQRPKFGDRSPNLHVVHMRILGNDAKPIQYRHAPGLYGHDGGER